MDEVCEVSDALMERYLEGEEISHEEIVGALKEGTNHGKIFPVVCGVATRNLGTSRLLDAIVEDLPSPVKHGSLRRSARSSSRPIPRTASCSPTSSRPAPTRSPGGSTCCASTRACCARDSQALNTRAHAKERIGQLIVFAGKEVGHRAGVRARRHRRGGQAQGDPRRRLAGRPRRADRDAAPEAARAGDGVRGRAQEQGRRGEGVRLPAAPAGGGPHDRPAPRPADRRADRRRALPGARRSDRRPPARPLRRGGHAEAAAGPLPGDDPRRRQGPRAPQEAVRRARASSATATSRSSRSTDPSDPRASSSSTRSRAA